jgi:hypothetical protein
LRQPSPVGTTDIRTIHHEVHYANNKLGPLAPLSFGEDELLPENETTFFIKGEAAGGSSSRTIFVKDSAGRVTHYIYREYGGTDRIVKKIR